MANTRDMTGSIHPGEHDFAKMNQWPRQLLAIQTAVSAAGDDLDRVFKIVLQSAIRLVPMADGGEIELREDHEIVCRAACGSTPRAVGDRAPLAGTVPGFTSITTQDRAGLRSAITAPIPFQGQHVGQLKLHSRTPEAFRNGDLLALQLLAWLVVQGLGRDAQLKEQQARADADRRFQATFDQAAVGIAHVAPDGRFILVNDTFCKIAGWEREELVARGFQGITHADDLEADLTYVQDLLEGRRASYSMEKRYIRKDGVIVWINLTVSLIHKADGSPDFFVSVIEDISARRAAEIDAEHDQLTGLLNRRGALRQLEAALVREGEWQHGVAAAFIDLDGFKRVNDNFGHDEGDRCLIKIAGALRGALRSDDVIARMGGDEFLALFPARNEDFVRAVLTRLQGGIEGISVGEPWEIGASLGVAIVPSGSALDPATVIATADRLMYRAKHSGSDEPFVATIPAAAA